MPDIGLQMNRRDAAIYAQWVRWMLGIEEGPWGPGSAMRAADRVIAEEGAAVRRVAKELWRVTQSYLWPTGKRELYRGLRHTRDDLDGKPLPWDLDYASLGGISYSEDVKVACYFADPGKRGMPGFHPVTGETLLPPNGYILTVQAEGSDVLFHWRWLLAVTGLFGIRDPHQDAPTALAQQEVTLHNSPLLLQRCHAWQGRCGDYVKARYPGGVWEPGNPDPYGEGWVG